MEKMREEFEAWAVMADLDTSHYIDNGEMGDYCDVVAQYAWMGWKASRAAICVNLPSSWYQDVEGYILNREDDVKSSLDEAGVRYE